MAYSEADYAPLIFKVSVPPYNRHIKAGQSVPIVTQTFLITQDGLEIPWSFLAFTDYPKITIFNPANTIVVNQATMTYSSTGYLTYLFDTTGMINGNYCAVFKGVHSNFILGQAVKHNILNRKVLVCTVI